MTAPVPKLSSRHVLHFRALPDAASIHEPHELNKCSANLIVCFYVLVHACDVFDDDLLNVISFDLLWRVALAAHSASQIWCYDSIPCLDKGLGLQVPVLLVSST